MKRNQKLQIFKQMTFIPAFVLLFISSIVYAQSGTSINSTGAPAHPSAMLDVSSNNSGVLIPRMTETEKLSISTPATGLMIYQTDGIEGFWYFDGVSWVEIKGTNVSPGAGSCCLPTMISNESSSAYTYAAAVQYCETLSEGGYTDWRMPEASEIQYFSGMPGAGSNYLWTKTHSPIDYQANQNFISVRLDNGRWRNGDELLSPVFSEVSGSSGTTSSGTSWVVLDSVTPANIGNWLKVTDITLRVRYGRVRAKFNFPNGTSTYTPTYSYTSSSVTTVMEWSNIQMPILVTSIVLEGQSTNSTYSQYGYLTVTGFEIAPLQKEGATLKCRCIR